MPLGRFHHLVAAALDLVLGQVSLVHEPIVFVPPDEEPHVPFAVHLVPVDFTENLPGRLLIEKTDHNPGILVFQVPHHRLRIVLEDLPVDNLDSLSLRLLLQIVQGCDKHLLGLLDHRDPMPAVLLEHLHPRRVVHGGRGVGSEQGGKPVSVGECWTGRPVTDGHQVPLAGCLGQCCADCRAARENHHLLVFLLIEHLVEPEGSKSTVALVVLVGHVQVVVGQQVDLI